MTQQQDYMIQLKDMNKWYGEFHVLKKHQLKCKERRKKSLSVALQAQGNRP